MLRRSNRTQAGSTLTLLAPLLVHGKVHRPDNRSQLPARPAAAEVFRSLWDDVEAMIAADRSAPSTSPDVQRATSDTLARHSKLMGKGGGRNAAAPFVIGLARLRRRRGHLHVRTPRGLYRLPQRSAYGIAYASLWSKGVCLGSHVTVLVSHCCSPTGCHVAQWARIFGSSVAGTRAARYPSGRMRSSSPDVAW